MMRSKRHSASCKETVSRHYCIVRLTALLKQYIPMLDKLSFDESVEVYSRIDDNLVEIQNLFDDIKELEKDDSFFKKMNGLDSTKLKINKTVELIKSIILSEELETDTEYEDVLEHERDYKHEIERNEYSSEEIAQEFCKRHEWDYDVDNWVGNKIGGILVANEYYIAFEDMVTDLRETPPVDEFTKWYDYNYQSFLTKQPTLNYESWLHGAPRRKDVEEDSYNQPLWDYYQQYRNTCERSDLYLGYFINAKGVGIEDVEDGEVYFTFKDKYAYLFCLDEPISFVKLRYENKRWVKDNEQLILELGMTFIKITPDHELYKYVWMYYYPDFGITAFANSDLKEKDYLDDEDDEFEELTVTFSKKVPAFQWSWDDYKGVLVIETGKNEGYKVDVKRRSDGVD